MAVDYRLQRYWREAQRRLVCDPVEVLKMLHTFGRREGESDQEHRARLGRQNAEYAAEADRLEELETQEEQRD